MFAHAIISLLRSFVSLAPHVPYTCLEEAIAELPSDTDQILYRFLSSRWAVYCFDAHVPMKQTPVSELPSHRTTSRSPVPALVWAPNCGGAKGRQRILVASGSRVSPFSAQGKLSKRKSPLWCGITPCSPWDVKTYG